MENLEIVYLRSKKELVIVNLRSRKKLIVYLTSRKKKTCYSVLEIKEKLDIVNMRLRKNTVLTGLPVRHTLMTTITYNIKIFRTYRLNDIHRISE